MKAQPLKHFAFNHTNTRCIPSVALVWNKTVQIFFVFVASSIFSCSRQGQVRIQSENIPTPLELADGSRVTLRQGATLTYTDGFGTGHRQVNLTGEGYFEIMHDPRHPFVAHCNGVTVTVLGTAFNIRLSRTTGEVEVTVTDGKVNVSDVQRDFGDLPANHQVLIDPERHEARFADTCDLYETLAWYYEGMATGNRGMGTVLSALERRYGAHIILENNTLDNCVLNAQPDFNQKLDDILEVFVMPVNATLIKQGDNTYIIRGGSCR